VTKLKNIMGYLLAPAHKNEGLMKKRAYANPESSHAQRKRGEKRRKITDARN